jgi:hypothetical protein
LTASFAGFVCPREQTKKTSWPSCCPLFNDVLGLRIFEVKEAVFEADVFRGLPEEGGRRRGGTRGIIPIIDARHRTRLPRVQKYSLLP